MFHRIGNSPSNSTPSTPPSEKAEPERKELFGIRRTIKGAATRLLDNVTSSNQQLSSSNESPSERRFSISNQATPPPILPSINSDLLGMMKEREKEQSQPNPQTNADSQSNPNSTTVRRRRQLQLDL